jgi:hypothetical protein
MIYRGTGFLAVVLFDSWGVIGMSNGNYMVVVWNVSTKYTGLPLMQLGDGDGGRGEAEDGDEEDGEGTISPNLSNKGHTFMCNRIKYVKSTFDWKMNEVS